jgi:hypothetical protein
MDELSNWLSLDEAAKHFGYSHPENLRQRLRELRRRGKVVDTGKPPSEYKAVKKATKDKIVVYWLNPKTAMLSINVPSGLLVPKRGKRARDMDEWIVFE